MKQDKPIQGVLARVECWTCGRKDSAVMLNYRLYQHDSADPTRPGVCLGPYPEIVFTVMLRDAGLDVREDSEDEEIDEGDLVRGPERELNVTRDTPFLEWRRERQQRRQGSAAGGETDGAAGA